MPTFDTPTPIDVTIELGVGDVRLEAGDRADTVVAVQPSDAAKRDDVTAAENTTVTYDGGRLLVRAPKGWKRYSWFSDGGSIDVRIELPAGSAVRCDPAMAAVHSTGRLAAFRCKTGAGDIDLDSVGDAQLRTGVGDITVTATAGADLSTGSGAIRIGSIAGDAVVKSSNGDVRLGEVDGDVRVRTASGNIAIDRAGAGVSAKTANGDITVGEVARGSVSADTAAGDVEIGVGPGTAAWLDVNTKFGHVRNGLDEADRPVAGDDTVEIRAQTATGDITIHRSTRSAGSDQVGGEE
jgi:hypothetical protein